MKYVKIRLDAAQSEPEESESPFHPSGAAAALQVFSSGRLVDHLLVVAVSNILQLVRVTCDHMRRKRTERFEDAVCFCFIPAADRIFLLPTVKQHYRICDGFTGGNNPVDLVLGCVNEFI